MKYSIRVIFFCWIFFGLSLYGNAKPNAPMGSDDFFLVFYVSKDGKNGHVGIAVDQYEFRKVTPSNSDTIKSGGLMYFDLWGPENITSTMILEDLKAFYHIAPEANEPVLDLNYFLETGIPKGYDYPCDGLLRIGSTPEEDLKLVDIIQAIMAQHPHFNPSTFNCSDFVKSILEVHFGQEINASEYIIVGEITTPNKLYTTILEKFEVEVLKKPDEKVNGSYIMSKLLGRLGEG